MVANLKHFGMGSLKAISFLNPSYRMAFGRRLLLLVCFKILGFRCQMCLAKFHYDLFDMIRSFEQLKSCDFVFLAFENI